jgi:hypothetical protein
VPLGAAPFERFDIGQVERWSRALLAPARIASSRVVTEYETYYGDRRGRRPLPVVALTVADSSGTTYYVDPASARFVQTVNTNTRWHHWLYRAPHSFELPFLYRYPWLWHVVVLALMLGGTALSLTALAIGWRRLARRIHG